MRTAFFASLREEARRMAADRNILLVLVIAPLVYTLVFGLTYYNAKVTDLPVVVVDADRSAASRSIIRALDATESLAVLEVLPDEGPVRDMLVREKVWAAVILPRDMERELKQGHQITVPVLVNTSNIIIGNYAWKGAQAALGTSGAMVGMDRMVRRGVSSSQVRASYQPIELQTRTLFNPGSNYAFFVTPLLIVLLIHQIVALAAGMSVAKHGNEDLYVPSPEHTFQDRVRDLFAEAMRMQSRLSPYVITGTFWMVISIVGTHPWLGIPRPASFGTALLLGVLLAWNGSLLGTLAGALIKDKIGVVQVLFFLSMPLLLLSGGSWPLEAMPWFIRGIAIVLPSTHAMTAYRALALEGASFFRVLPVLSILVMSGVVLSLATAAALRSHHIAPESLPEHVAAPGSDPMADPLPA